MLQILPFLVWLAPITSGVLLVILWDLGELRRLSAAAFLIWFLLAGYLQFFAGSPIASAVGLGSQTILAVFLFWRWKLSG